MICHSQLPGRRPPLLSVGLRLLLLLLVLLPLLGTARPAAADSWHTGVIWGADWVDISHISFIHHTHENSIGFNLNRLYMKRPQQIQVRAHSSLDTWVPGWGTIENWIPHGEGDYAVIAVPTRFADLVFLEPMGPLYYNNWPYYLEVRWYGP